MIIESYSYYRVRIGETVYIMHTAVPYRKDPIVGFNIRTGDIYSWKISGAFSADSIESPLDIVAGPLPVGAY